MMIPSPKILCMYSGGLDSAGALWQVIHDPQYRNHEILVHHVHLVNATGRFRAEKQAVDQTIPLFQTYTTRKLYFSSTIMDFSFLRPKVPIDADVYGFVAANLVNIDPGIEYIALGRTLDDKNSGGDPSIQIVDCVDRALVIAGNSSQIKSKAKSITPVVGLSKQQIWDLLPPKIRSATWSCRRPNYITAADGSISAAPCKLCHACQAIQALK